jgi:hypothetical protein
MDHHRALELSGAVVVSTQARQGQFQDHYPEDGQRLMAAAISGVCAVVHAEGFPD